MDSAHAAYRGCPAGKRGHHCCAGTRRPWYFWLYAGLSVCVTLAIRTARKGHGSVGSRARADAMCWALERGRIRVLTARRGAVQVGVAPRPLGASQKRGSQAFSCGQQDRNASLDAFPKGAGQSIVHCPSKLCSRDSESWAPAFRCLATASLSSSTYVPLQCRGGACCVAEATTVNAARASLRRG
jgi:hypothetical protein